MGCGWDDHPKAASDNQYQKQINGAAYKLGVWVAASFL